MIRNNEIDHQYGLLRLLWGVNRSVDATSVNPKTLCIIIIKTPECCLQTFAPIISIIVIVVYPTVHRVRLDCLHPIQKVAKLLRNILSTLIDLIVGGVITGGGTFPETC